MSGLASVEPEESGVKEAGEELNRLDNQPNMAELLNKVSGAVLSADRQHRYLLHRRWEWGYQYNQFVLFVGLNPSTADETEDDPTIRRCRSFATKWGYGTMVMANLFSYRATKPADMKAAEMPVGPRCDPWLRYLAAHANLIVCAWGAQGGHLDREREVRHLLTGYDLRCFGVTQAGHPKHPLYLKADTELEVFK